MHKKLLLFLVLSVGLPSHCGGVNDIALDIWKKIFITFGLAAISFHFGYEKGREVERNKKIDIKEVEKNQKEITQQIINNAENKHA